MAALYTVGGEAIKCIPARAHTPGNCPGLITKHDGRSNVPIRSDLQQRRNHLPYEFKLNHDVEFANMDMAGIVHFANFFRYMEVTEHAFLRSIGLSVHMKEAGDVFSFPG